MDNGFEMNDEMVIFWRKPRTGGASNDTLSKFSTTVKTT